METATLVLATIACFLSVCAFLAAAGAIVTVIGWAKSTHKVIQVPVEPTTFGYDLPPEYSPASQLPAEETLSPEAKEYIRRQREAALSDDDFE